jgi:NAD(P)-dependent dehydrogenase (short-subunit alcohol dehydrogenase family)
VATSALVTGAGRGIGRSIALKLAGQGMNVALADIDANQVETVAREARRSGVQAHAYAVDLKDTSAIPYLVQQITGEWGSLDILANNAGIMRITPLLDVIEAEWDAVLNVNLKAAFFCLQACARQMVQQKHGRIINISSISALGARPDHVHYAASKAGLLSITRSAALSLAPYGITVNAIAPGIVDTPLQREVQKARGKALALSVEESMARVAANIPLGHMGTPDDVAGAVAFLVSPEASYITGQLLVIDGGVQMLGLPSARSVSASHEPAKNEGGPS